MPPRRQHGWLGRALVRSFAGLVVFLGLGISFISSQEAPASAGIDVECAVTSEFVNRGVEPVGVGPETMFGPGVSATQAAADAASGPGSSSYDDYVRDKGINWDDPDTYTLYESNSVRGALWSETEWYQQDDFSEVNGNEDEKRCTLSGEIMTLIAQMVFDLDRTITSATIALRQSATDATPFIEMIRDMTDEVGIMSEKVWAAGLVIAIMATGFWVIAKWGGRNQREIVQGLIWVVCSVIGVGFLLAPSHASPGDPNYLWVAESANETTSQFVEDLGDALLPQGGDGPCALREGAEDRGTRMLDCHIYETLVFDPWAHGQFGDLGDEPIPYKDIDNDKTDEDLKEGTDIRIAQIRAQSVSLNEAYGSGKVSLGKDDADNFDPDTKYGQWNLIRAQMWEKHNDDYKYWKGEQGSARIAAAFSGLIASILVGIFIAVTSLLTMLWNAVPVVLLIALPLVGTFSVFPPLQKFLRGWAQTWLKATILGLVFAVAQMLSLVMVGGVMSSDQALGWKCLLMVVMVMALWKVIQAAREDAFTPNLGGDGQVFDGDRIGADTMRTARRARSKAAVAGAVLRRSGRVADRAGRGGKARVTPGDRVKQQTETKAAKERKDFAREHGRDMTPEELEEAKKRIAHEATAPKIRPSRSGKTGLTGTASPGDDRKARRPRRDHGREKPDGRVKTDDKPVRKPRRGPRKREDNQ